MAQKIDAAILYADLRGFTALADRLAIEPLTATLNAYFDCLGPAIERHGGQVLKFLGDGLLASFQLQAGQDAMPICRAVLAAADGRVVYSGAGLRGYGNLIILKHNNTYLTAYAHNQTLLVKEDQSVRKGQKIAEMGSSDTDRVKLHFEIRRQGKPVDPAKYLPAR